MIGFSKYCISASLTFHGFAKLAKFKSLPERGLFPSMIPGKYQEVTRPSSFSFWQIAVKPQAKGSMTFYSQCEKVVSF